MFINILQEKETAKSSRHLPGLESCIARKSRKKFLCVVGALNSNPSSLQLSGPNKFENKNKINKMKITRKASK